MKKKIILQDPTSFHVYDLKINGKKRRIILIGEIHNIIDCPPDQHRMTISDFIKQYHQSIGTDKVLDIFSESFYIEPKKIGWLSTLYYLISFRPDENRALSYLRKRLGPCSPKYNFSLYECPENLRIHLCDVRFIKEMDYTWKKNNKQECFINKLFKIGLSYIYPQKIPRANCVFSNLVSFVNQFLFDTQSPQYHTRLLQYILTTTKIKKQLEHVSPSKVRNQLQQWTDKTYKNQIQNARIKFLSFKAMYERENKDLVPVGYVSEQCIQRFMHDISLPILYIISVFMDLYLMSRLLRSFADSTYAENSIVYVGEFHAKEYRKILKTLGAKQVFHKTSIRGPIYTSCVDISHFYYTHMVSKKKSPNKTN